MYGRRRSNAPYWITTHYGGKCDKCGFGIKKGETALYFPDTRNLLCAGDGCGKEHLRQAESAKLDQAMYPRGERDVCISSQQR